MENASQSSLLSNWRIRLTKAQIGHYMTAEKYLKYHNILGILLVISSAFVSFSFFQQTTSNIFKYAVIGASFLSTILASLQTFVRPSEKAEIHRTKASKYGVLRRKLELFLSSTHSDRETNIFLNELHKDWANVAGDAPLTPRNIRNRIANILKREIDEDMQLKETSKN